MGAGRGSRNRAVGTRLLGAALLCSLLTACGDAEVAAPAADPGAAAGVTDCGTFTLGQGESLPASAARCLIEAVHAGRPARLAVTRPTVEGDPIPVTYTAGADGRVEVVTDARRDRFGGRTVTRDFCTGPSATPELEFARCS
ncbi:hypothetical protein ACWT_5585 [Actinoplanes sp. SE50]|uniref:hypothetical protein n=1 Tax=unclassified Actinoplanes TaxID=2626549 RepID=UPI00023ECF10|nr:MULTISPECIES: hypothetical protein [unclassified Actinoplanes]AEV86602.1 hypothetical protein ACPL_5715 [Actinoplanes sp. SE50/110]ATO85000.1 hypothetical protein ACWT_5585 [Actinoplanes sp. SE50]SLM02409.1 hypothetical protein ACSP50_5658 [Actinoplanes sp. SE50/110]